MTTLFSTRILESVVNGKTRIVDAGCGLGVHALYLAQRNPKSMIIAYDISQDRIDIARKRRHERAVGNVSFLTASHDDVNLGFPVDVIYTADSLIGDDELPAYCDDPFEASKDIVGRRLSNFNRMLSKEGIYVVVWAASDSANSNFVQLARTCGFESMKTMTGRTVSYFYDEPVCYSALIFKKDFFRCRYAPQ